MGSLGTEQPNAFNSDPHNQTVSFSSFKTIFMFNYYKLFMILSFILLIFNHIPLYNFLPKKYISLQFLHTN